MKDHSWVMLQNATTVYGFHLQTLSYKQGCSVSVFELTPQGFFQLALLQRTRPFFRVVVIIQTIHVRYNADDVQDIPASCMLSLDVNKNVAA